MRWNEIINEAAAEWKGKQVVAQHGDFMIAVDDPESATYVTVWTPENKRVGSLSTRTTPDKVGRDYLSVSRAEIDPKYRGQGLGIAMYRALLAHLDPKWKGLGSYLPDQANKKQVPKIWQRIGGKKHPENSDHIVAPRINL